MNIVINNSEISKDAIEMEGRLRGWIHADLGEIKGISWGTLQKGHNHNDEMERQGSCDQIEETDEDERSKLGII